MMGCREHLLDSESRAHELEQLRLELTIAICCYDSRQFICEHRVMYEGTQVLEDSNLPQGYCVCELRESTRHYKYVLATIDSDREWAKDIFGDRFEWFQAR